LPQEILIRGALPLLFWTHQWHPTCKKPAAPIQKGYPLGTQLNSRNGGRLKKVQKKNRFLKNPNNLLGVGVLGFYWVWALLGFRIFHLNEQLGSLLLS